MRPVGYIAILLSVLTAAGLFWGSFAYFKAQELEKAAARLTLFRSTVEAALEHFAHMPFLLSLDPVVISTLSGGNRGTLNTRLARFAQNAGIDAIYLMDANGLTISASNADTSNSFVGQNYGYRPYFKQALAGELGEFYGIGATTGIPGYFYAMAVGARQAEDRGVIAIKLDLADLQDSWQASGERIILSNADGVVLLASDPAWRYRSIQDIATEDRARIIAARQFAQEPLTPLNWTPDPDAQTAEIDGARYLYVRTSDLPNGWSMHFFAPMDPAITRAWLSAGSLLLLCGLVFLTWQIRRERQIRSALRRSEEEEAQLREANARLAVEIEERRTAEKQLQQTQAKLERAGRLAALGQLASSVTHELGQPIAAMRNQLAAEEMTAGASKLGGKMQALVDRMEDITRQLKFFSRKGRDRFELVDLGQVIQTALELLAPNIAAVGAQVCFEPVQPIPALEGNKLRLEQVVTNLVRNALDAVEGAAIRDIDIRLGETEDTVWFEVSDTGHGLKGQSLDDLREPFATTRESGKGMGLGLTISAGIVTDHEGTLSAEDSADGRTVFRATFPSPRKEAKT